MRLEQHDVASQHGAGHVEVLGGDGCSTHLGSIFQVAEALGHDDCRRHTEPGDEHDPDAGAGTGQNLLAGLRFEAGHRLAGLLPTL